MARSDVAVGSEFPTRFSLVLSVCQFGLLESGRHRYNACLRFCCPNIVRNSMRFKFVVLVCCIIACALNAPKTWAQYGQVKPCPENLRVGFDSINQEDSEQILRTLAGREFAGRGTGQQGYLKAAQFVASKLVELGLQPIGSPTDLSPSNPPAANAFLHYVPLQQRQAIVEHCSITAAGRLSIPAKGNIGFDSYSDGTQIDGQLMFINCPRGKFQFPQGTDLRDSVVFYQAHEDDFKYVQRKMEQYRALAIFRIIDHTPISVNQVITERSSREPVKGSITKHAATAMLKSLGYALPGKMQGEKFADVTHTNTNVTLSNPTRQSQIMVPNVVGLLPGAEPALQHEFVVLGAHLDHLGVGSSTTFYGADDNGSGSTAVLNIAKALVANPLKPKRSVLFMWFAAEELGLLGSEYYCNHPKLPHANMACMLNIDMVGRNESSARETAEENEGSIHLVGSTKGGTALHEAIMSANEHVGFRFEYDEESVFKRSDQYNFFLHGVEVAFLFGGFHPDYHDDSDSIEKINFKKVVSASRLYYLTVFNAAEHSRFPAVAR